MRRMEHRVKSFTAMLLSMCLLLPQGAVNVWAADAVPETAAAAAVTGEAAAAGTADEAPAAAAMTGEAAAAYTASASDAGEAAENAEASSAKEKASDSDAMLDEDGLLLDGKVTDDVISAPERKTEVIAPALDEDLWYRDYTFDLDYEHDGIMILTGWNNYLKDPVIKNEIVFGGETYQTAIGPRLFSDNETVETIEFWDGVIFPADCSQMFAYSPNLRSVDMSGCDLTEVTTMEDMFTECSSLSSVVFGSQNTENLTDMSQMFRECGNISTIDISGLNTSEVTTTKGMFLDCTSLETLSLPDDFLSAVTDAGYMFSGCSGLTESFFRTLDYSNVTDAGHLFAGCTSLTEFDFNRYDFSNAADISGMFSGCTELRQINIRDFDASRVENMDHLFDECSSLQELDMTDLNLSSVTTALGMLNKCVSLNSVYTPLMLQVPVNLPCEMFTAAGKKYAYLPRNLTESIHIADNQSYVLVTGVRINTEARTVAPGNTFQLAAWPQPSNANNKAVTWTSMDPAVAEVDENGLVTAKESGTAEIVVTTEDGGYTASCMITAGIPVTSVKINSTARTIAPGKTFQLAAWPQPTNAANKAVTWTSSDPSVATVDSTGLVTAVMVGTADITVKTKDRGKTAVCRITVNVPVTSVKINTTARTIKTGETFQLAAWPQPANATNKAVTWTSSDPSVATVDSSGLVYAAKTGKTTITVKTVDGGKTAACVITVGAWVNGVKINAAKKTIALGKTFQLAAWPQPSNAANKAVTWSSSNTAVATVSSTGLVKAVKTGSARIQVKTVDGGYIANCWVTVNVPVTSVKINTTAKTLEKWKGFQLAAWPQPANATNKTVTWTSSNTKVATVSGSGYVYAVDGGTATITVKTSDGGYTASCKVTVTVPVSWVKLNTNNRILETGKTFQLAAWPQPANATNKKVTWTSSNSAVATVSSTGLVKAVKAGNATITAKTADGGYTATCRITAEAPAIFVDGYAVSTPTSVHWTDDFKIAFTFGKTRDGAIYHKYAYKIYDAATGKALNNGHGTMGGYNGRSVELTIGQSTLEKMQTGSYYFKVYAEDENRNQISPEVQSNTKRYTRPGRRLTTPTNLRWNGKKLLYNIPDSDRQYISTVYVELMYSQSANGSFTKKASGKFGLDYCDTWLERHMDTPGYYKCKIQTCPADPQAALPSSYSAESPVCHVTQ